MNTTRKNRVISMMLAVVMVFSMMTTSAFAENDGKTENAVEETGAPVISDGETEEDAAEETGTPAPSNAPVISDGETEEDEEKETGTPTPSDAPVISDGNARKDAEENAENGVALLNGEGDAVENAVAEVIDADGKTTGQYATLAEAIKAASDGCTVKLIKSGETYTLTSDEDFPICIEYNSITLDLNGCTLKRRVNAMQQGILIVNANTEVIVRNGTLELEDSGSSNPAQAIAMPSGWSPALTLENMTVHAAKGYAIYAQGGTLCIRKGTYGKVLIHDGNVTANLSGGSYDSVECYYNDYAKLLATGYIFADQAGNYIDPSTMKNEPGNENIKNIQVILCTHEGGFTGGVCNRCGYVCPHTTVENDVCTACNAQMAAQDDAGKYYLDLSDAFAGAADGGTVTMLADIDGLLDFCLDAEGEFVEKTVILYMNGHSLCWSNENYVREVIMIGSGKLIIADDAVISLSHNPQTPAVSAESAEESKGTLEFRGKATITGGIDFYEYGKLEGGLKEGTILQKGGNSHSVSVEQSGMYHSVRELLPEGYAYAEYSDSFDAENPTIIDGSVKQLTQDVIVVKCTHKNGGTSLLENGTCLGCGYVCPHTSIDGGNCTDCGAQMVAQVGDRYYSTLAAAIEAAKDGGTVTLLDLLYVQESITVKTGTNVTINVNNVSWEAGDAASPVLTVDGGSVTLNEGWLSLAQGSTASGVVVVKSGSLTMGESMVFGNNSWAGPAIVVEGGDLTLGKDTKLYDGMKTSVEGETLASYLPKGYAFAENYRDGQILNGYVQELNVSIQMVVAPHTHDLQKKIKQDGSGDIAGYSCVCGFICEHKWHFDANGICEDCGLPCKHDNVCDDIDNKTKFCGYCKMNFAVQVTIEGVSDRFYMQTFDSRGTENTLQTLLNDDAITPSGSTVTLLTDDLQAFAFVDDGKSITLDLNGKNLIETGNGILVGAGSKLTVTGEGSSSENDQQRLPCVFNVQGGTLVLKEMEFGGTFNSIRVGSGTLTSPREKEDAIHIGTLEIGGANAEVSFKAAAFDKITIGEEAAGVSVKLGDLLQKNCGNAFQNGDGTFLPYNTEVTIDSPAENVKTAACYHDSLGEENTCDYCGWAHLVAIYMTDSGTVGTLNPAAEWTETEINKAANTAFRTWNNMGGTLRLFTDLTLEDRTITNRYATHIDLNGNKITGGTLTLDEDSRGNGTDVTIENSAVGRNASFANVTVNNGASLTVDGVRVDGVTLCEGSTLHTTDGVFGTITTTAEGRTLISFLPDGFAFAGSDGGIVNGHVSTLTDVKVVPHTDHDYKWNTTSHELVCFCGHVKETDTTAPVITGITDGETRYGDAAFTVTDKNPYTVTVDGKAVTPDESGRYTIPADNDTHVVTAADLAGNSTTVTVTVNKIHNVTLVSGPGYTLTGASTIGYGQDYTLIVTIAEGYSKTAGYRVRVNGERPLDPETPDKTREEYLVTNYMGDLTFTVEGVADITAPENVEIRIGDQSFATLRDSIYPYNMFFKNAQTVTVNASDKGSGVKTVEYLLADAVYGKDSLPTDGWTQAGFANGTGSFDIRSNGIGSVYVRVTDAAGNASVVNSAGMVVYTDSTADTESFSFTRLSAADASFKVNLNGNAVKSVSVGDTVMDGALYTVSADGTITLKNAYLKTLPADEYAITVAYEPMGIIYADGNGSEAPAATGVTLTVLKGIRMLTFSAPDAVYGGEPYDGLTITDAPEGTSVKYKLKDAADSAYTETAPVNAGSYTVQITVPADDNYNARTFTADFTVSPIEVTVTGTAVKAAKDYDGSTAAEITGNGTLTGVLDADSGAVTLVPGTASYADKNVGKGKTVSFTGFTLGGAAGGNYALKEQPASVTADISAIELTVENLKVKDKLYDGTAKAEIDGTPVLKGAVSGDDVQLVCGTPAFAQTACDDNAAVAVSFTEFALSGADSGNYTLAQPSGSTAWIRAWYASGSEYTAATQEWSNQPFTVAATDGYLLSLTDTANGEWLNSLTGTERATGDANYLTFYVKNAATGAISTANRFAYLYETTAPFGSVTIDGVTFRTLLDKDRITFGKFFKSDVTVDVAGADDASGVRSVEYYTSDKALTLEEVKAVTGWKPGYRFTVAAGETARFVVYARVTDNAGNTAYFCSDGAEIDITAPTITGVENNGVYYVTRRVTADDANLRTVTVNGSPVESAGSFDLAGDKDAVYTVAATDKAGNVTEYTVTMRPISAVTDALRGITAENVKSTNAETVRTVAGRIRAITAESSADIAGAAQWNKLLAASASCNALENRIAEVAAETARLTRAVNAYDIDKVTSADKADIEKLLTGINALLSGGNLTDAERAAQEALRKTARALLDRIAEEKSAAESDEIAAVRNITRDNVTAGDKTALEKAEKALEDALSGSGNYTETERNDLNARLDAVKEALTAIGNAEKAAGEIEKLPSVDEVQLTDRDEIERVSEIVEALTENEKTLLGKEAIGKLMALKERLDKLAAEENETALTAPGGTGSPALRIILLLVCAGAVIIVIVCVRKKKNAEETQRK